MPRRFTKNIVVIGGGISGLACAFRLRQLGAEVTLLEASERPAASFPPFEGTGSCSKVARSVRVFPRASGN